MLDSQKAFVEGRQITYTSVIANEIIDHWLKKGKLGVICKLDIKKSL